jgi:predicted dehydrogenase
MIARDRGRVVAVGAVGLHIPRKIYYEKEISFINSRSYGPGRYDPSYEEGGQDYPIGYVRWTECRNLEAFVDLLASGQVDVKPLITHRFLIEKAAEAYELVTGKTKEPFLGVLLTYQATGATYQASGTISQIKPETWNLEHRTSHIALGVLGAGNFATAVMLPAIKKIPGITLIGIASASGLSAQHAAQKFGFRYATSDEAQILTDPEINTVAILTRHNLHARQIIAALQAGKHVFCEKPLALNSEQLSAISKSVGQYSESSEQPTASLNTDLQNTGPLLMVGFNRRFAPLAQRLKAFVDERKEPLIAHYRVNAGTIPLTHWVHDPAQGGGRIIGEGCHFVDFLTFLVGNPPSAVFARALPDAGRYREDNAILTFTFPDGSIGTVSYLANGDKAFPKERVEVFAAGHVAVLDDFRSLEMVNDGRRQVIRSRLRQDKGHRAEWEAFTAAVAAGGPSPIPYEHLFGVAQAMLAAVEALRSGETTAIGS